MMETKRCKKEVKAQQTSREMKPFVSQALCLERTEEEVVQEEGLTGCFTVHMDRDPASVKEAVRRFQRSW